MNNQRGTAVVEFVLGSGVLLVAFMGTFQFGYTLLQYNRLETAVVQASRYASLVPYDSATTTPSATFLAHVQNMVLYGAPLGGSTPILNGLTKDNVNLSVSFTNGVPGTITVSITGYSINGLFGASTLTGKPKVAYPYQGIWSPI